MILATNSGILVHTHGLPMTSAFRNTLNEFAGKKIFPISPGVSWNETLTPVPSKPEPRRLTILTEPRARDEWTIQMSCKARRGPDWKESPVGNFYQSNGRRGRKNKYKNRNYRAELVID